MIGLSVRAQDPTKAEAVPTLTPTNLVELLLGEAREVTRGAAVWQSPIVASGAAPRRHAEDQLGRSLSADDRARLSLLGEALDDLAVGRRDRATIRAGIGIPWDLGLERVGERLLVSLFRGGADPEVAVFHRATSLASAQRAIRLRLEAETSHRVESAHRTDPIRRSALTDTSLDDGDQDFYDVPENPGGLMPQSVLLELDTENAVAFGAEWQQLVSETPSGLDAQSERPSTPPTESARRSDLLPLLFRGRISARFGHRERTLNNVHVFLLLEQLISLAQEGLESSLQGRPLVRRHRIGGAYTGLRIGLSSPAGATVTFGVDARASDPLEARDADAFEPASFPGVPIAAFARAVLAFGQDMLRRVIRRDRSQAQNLRVAGVRMHLRALAQLLRDAGRCDAKINHLPDSYRAYALHQKEMANPLELGHARIRFAAKWHAAIPALDLRATFLCGHSLIVGAARELLCLDRATGEVRWQRAVGRAVSVITPAGLARIEPEGKLELLDIDTGEARFGARIKPRVGPVAGAVVHGPGLPRLLVVSEGARQLAAVDLDSGDIAWRYTSRHGGAFRLRRAGKLLIVSSGEQALSALDVTSGDVVWRATGRLRFAAPAAIDGDSLFAVSGDGSLVGRAQLHHLDPWSGERRYAVDLPPGATLATAPLIGARSVLLTAINGRGTSVHAFDRETGELRFQQRVTTGTACLSMIDNQVIINSDMGELLSLDADSGEPRYRHWLSDPDADRPRRLEPVLRGGALFVPQSRVHILRPRDGELIGTVPADLIPDMVRVDEQCNVYIAEESGHIAAFRVAAKLALVRST